MEAQITLTNMQRINGYSIKYNCLNVCNWMLDQTILQLKYIFPQTYLLRNTSSIIVSFLASQVIITRKEHDIDFFYIYLKSVNYNGMLALGIWSLTKNKLGKSPYRATGHEERSIFSISLFGQYFPSTFQAVLLEESIFYNSIELDCTIF